MATKKSVPNVPNVTDAEKALEAARAELERAQAFVLAADPSEVLKARDQALIAEAGVRRAEDALAEAKATEADRDRASRLAQLAELSDDEGDVLSDLTDAARRVVECEALLEQAKAAAKATHEKIDARRDQGKKLAASLGVPAKLPRAARYFRSERSTTSLQPETGEAGLYPALLAIAERDAGRLSENECARRVCWAMGTQFPKGEKPTADPSKPIEGTLHELRALGVTDRMITDLALSGVLARYYAARREGLEAYATGTRAHNAHRNIHVAEQFITDLTTAFKSEEHSHMARGIFEQLSEGGVVNRDSIQWSHVQQILKAVRGGALASSLEPSERTLFAGPQPSAPSKWDPRACLDRLGARGASEAAE
jgi:hypothetical protein